MLFGVGFDVFVGVVSCLCFCGCIFDCVVVRLVLFVVVCLVALSSPLSLVVCFVLSLCAC